VRRRRVAAVNFLSRAAPYLGGVFVSIVRIGLAETKRFAEGYEAIFGKKASAERQAEEPAEKAAAEKKKKDKKSKKK
jgi:hypothetical protein